jgi:hypothetical protein
MCFPQAVVPQPASANAGPAPAANPMHINGGASPAPGVSSTIITRGSPAQRTPNGQQDPLFKPGSCFRCKRMDCAGYKTCIFDCNVFPSGR